MNQRLVFPNLRTHHCTHLPHSGQEVASREAPGRRQSQGAEVCGAPELDPCLSLSQRCFLSQSIPSSRFLGDVRLQLVGISGHRTAATHGPSRSRSPGRRQELMRRAAAGIRMKIQEQAGMVERGKERRRTVGTGQKRRFQGEVLVRGQLSWIRRWSSPCWEIWSRCCTHNLAHVSQYSISKEQEMSMNVEYITY